jgi:hypothetical protein
VPKGKKVKVLTHRSCYIEPAMVPEFGEGASSTAEARQAAPIVQSIEEPIVVPKVPTVGPTEAKDGTAEEPIVEKVLKLPEILSHQQEQNCQRYKKLLSQLPKGGGWLAY